MGGPAPWAEPIWVDFGVAMVGEGLSEWWPPPLCYDIDERKKHGLMKERSRQQSSIILKKENQDPEYKRVKSIISIISPKPSLFTPRIENLFVMSCSPEHRIHSCTENEWSTKW